MERGEGSNQFPNIGDQLIGKDEESGNGAVVSSVLSRFDAVRRRFLQVGTVHGEVLEALRIFKNRGLYTNNKKRVGSTPGVAVGDIFYLQGEMDLVGLHQTNFGVDFIAAGDSEANKQMAISILSSGENADRNEDPDTLVFTGLGGTNSDQTLKGMNLSLETAFQKRSIVRVTRSKKDEKRTNGTIFIYDGLFWITKMWEEKGNNGFKVFKFKLVREPDQKPAFGIWKSVEQWKNGLVTRPGLILQDFSSGAENLKVSLVNEVDHEKGPASFIYVSSLKHAVINIPPMVDCCTCRPRSCDSRNGNCTCVERNFGGLPYVERVLVTRGPIVFECGGSCRCSVECKNKMIQTGLKFNFEVFKTIDCGWGLRSWDPIRAGSFICEYAGDIIAEGEKEEDDDYIFDGLRVFKSFQWNYEPELVGEDASERVSENHLSSSLVISAKKSGNIARFMNHSCSSNVFWQIIAREQNGLWCTYIGFFAMKHIPPLTELRYDYGASRGGGKKMCLCRSAKCSGLFG